jgi:hypothetical protein
MILGRWGSYINNGHGGNKGLKDLGFDYIKENFTYSILDTFRSAVDDAYIIEREIYWKNVLLTRERDFGYNEN